ncbi:MAG TPA: hypothetical protein VEG38_21765 [Acidimicrobiia bacterium]|nr:hypothetical protein [Acidimicrobiia bacterium]
MPSFGAADLLVLLVFVVLVLDSRRLHALARSSGRGRPDLTVGIPAGAHPDRAGLTLRHIQMRHHVDWEDGGIGWDGPEILPFDEREECEAFAEPEASPDLLPVLWKPFPALLPAGATGAWIQPSSTTSSPTETRPPVTTAA